MQRVFQRLEIKPGSQEEYKRRHDEVWPEMIDLMRQAGIRNYSIWNDGVDLFCYFETNDLDECKRVIAQSDVKKRWDIYMSDILVNWNASVKVTEPAFLFEG